MDSREIGRVAAEHGIALTELTPKAATLEEAFAGRCRQSAQRQVSPGVVNRAVNKGIAPHLLAWLIAPPATVFVRRRGCWWRQPCALGIGCDLLVPLADVLAQLVKLLGDAAAIGTNDGAELRVEEGPRLNIVEPELGGIAAPGVVGVR